MEAYSFSGLVASFIFLILWLKAKRSLRNALEMEANAKEGAKEAEANAKETVARVEDKYAQIISHDEEVDRLKAQALGINSDIRQLRADYAEKRTLLDKLSSQLAIYDDRLAFAELGVYEPHFDFGDSESYKDAIRAVRDSQKAMTSNKSAAICPTDWTVEGSRSKGKTMISRQVRLTLRAFNNECEAAIANTRWNNAVAMEKRIHAATKAIDKENTSMNISLNAKYVRLKTEELRLTHEYREQLKVEKEDRAEVARSEREEKKLLADAAAAHKAEIKYQALLDKARREAGVNDSDDLKKKIEALEADLADAHATSERAKAMAMAEMTRSGFVYVISNVGSFGDKVVKIGLTRRMDPNDRVKELGDASVPFSFDTHAMIHSEDAPALETSLHREFAEKRVNMANMRKEFFRVGLDEIEAAVLRLAPDASFFRDREAQEWHETMARRNETLQQVSNNTDAEFPASI